MLSPNPRVRMATNCTSQRETAQVPLARATIMDYELSASRRRDLQWASLL